MLHIFCIVKCYSVCYIYFQILHYVVKPSDTYHYILNITTHYIMFQEVMSGYFSSFLIEPTQSGIPIT